MRGRAARTGGVRAWLVVLLAIVLVTSTLSHVAGAGGHDAAPAHAHEHTLPGADGSDHGDCPDHAGQPHGMHCCMASGCSAGAPIAAFLAASMLNRDAPPNGAGSLHPTRMVGALFRPPRIS